MVIIETEEYLQFQLMLAGRPDVGALIKGGGGLRKIRWAVQGRGKSGGGRVIYYWAVPQEQLLLLW